MKKGFSMLNIQNILAAAQQTGLIEAEQLHTVLNHHPLPKLKFIDASYGLSLIQGHSPEACFHMARIDHAAYFDIDMIADTDSHLPHMLPDADKFSHMVSAMGITNDDFIICYDQTGISFAAARAWWMFRGFGHHRVAVLNGGLKHWLSLGLPIQQGHTNAAEPIHKTSFTASGPHNLVSTMQDVTKAIQNNTEFKPVILDARPAERFLGVAQEPRPHMKSGHMDGAINIPFSSLIDPHTGLMIPAQQTADIFATINKQGPIITTCGSGVTACVLALALHRLGADKVSVYDGSWSEWGSI